MNARSRHGLIIGLAALAFVALTGVLASLGGPHDLGTALSSVVYVLIVAGLPAAAYLGAGIGLGRLFSPLTRDATDPRAINAALGVATMLWITSAVGSIWVDASMIGRIAAIIPIVIGLALLAYGAVRTRVEVRLHALVIAIPATLLVAAALNPPGWLWASEFGGYDALSYHLQLPQEWIELGRIAPLEHNVYSFLPGYIEGAFTHVAIVAGVERPYSVTGHPTGLLTGEGLASISCQLLHAGLAVFSAWLVGRATRAAAVRMGWTGAALVAAELAAALFFLATPWVIVTGSLAYNEMGVTAMLAGALLVAVQDGVAPWKRGLACGWLIGMACGAKPTAFFMAGVPLAVVLFSQMRARDWVLCAGAGCLAGLVALSPWLVRNAIVTSNPVFPYATSLFGDAHWTTEQVDRFRSHHSYKGSFAERLSLMVMQDPDDPAGARHRGLMHAQWLIFFPMSLVGAVVCLAGRWRDRLTWSILIMAMLQLAAWLILTHVQSRFLLPMAVTGAALFGLGAARAAALRCTLTGKIGLGLAGICVLVQLAAALWIFTQQQSGQPNARLTMSPSMITGDDLDEEQVRASAIASINRMLPAGATLYLLGDAAPFYCTRDVIYNTTWDAWPLGDAVRAAPGDPGAWTAALRATGIDHVMVDEIGLGLFWRSGTHDPVVTPEILNAWLEHPSTRPVQTWVQEGKHLFRLESR